MSLLLADRLCHWWFFSCVHTSLGKCLHFGKNVNPKERESVCRHSEESWISLYPNWLLECQVNLILFPFCPHLSSSSALFQSIKLRVGHCFHGRGMADSGCQHQHVSFLHFNQDFQLKLRNKSNCSINNTSSSSFGSGLRTKLRPCSFWWNILCWKRCEKSSDFRTEIPFWLPVRNSFCCFSQSQTGVNWFLNNFLKNRLM